MSSFATLTKPMFPSVERVSRNIYQYHPQRADPSTESFRQTECTRYGCTQNNEEYFGACTRMGCNNIGRLGSMFANCEQIHRESWQPQQQSINSFNSTYTQTNNSDWIYDDNQRYPLLNGSISYGNYVGALDRDRLTPYYNDKILAGSCNGPNVCRNVNAN